MIDEILAWETSSTGSNITAGTDKTLSLPSGIEHQDYYMFEVAKQSTRGSQTITQTATVGPLVPGLAPSGPFSSTEGQVFAMNRQGGYWGGPAPILLEAPVAITFSNEDTAGMLLPITTNSISVRVSSTGNYRILGYRVPNRPVAVDTVSSWDSPLAEGYLHDRRPGFYAYFVCSINQAIPGNTTNLQTVLVPPPITGDINANTRLVAARPSGLTVSAVTASAITRIVMSNLLTDNQGARSLGIQITTDNVDASTIKTRVQGIYFGGPAS